MSRLSCCEVCDRNPTCGVDCGSCETSVCDQCKGMGSIPMPADVALWPGMSDTCPVCDGEGSLPVQND